MRLFARRLRGLLGAGFLLVVGAGGVLAAASPAGCATAPPCARNSDCINAYCSSGVCKQDCVDSELDCPHGSHCNLVAQCASDEPSGSTTTGAGGASPTSTASAGGAGPGATTTSGPGVTSGVTSGPTSGTGGTPPTGKATFDPCLADSDCAPNLACRPLTRNGTLRCLPTCASNAGCPSGTRCETLNGASFCAGIDVGRPCVDGTTCNFACVPGPSYCTMQCTGGADCPNGYGCMAIGGQSVCVKAEAPCGPGDTAACIAPAACDTSPTLVVGGCTLACTSANDCPRRAAGLPAWSCDGLCRRPSDVLGPLEGGFAPAQYACNSQSQPANLCNDNQHIDFNAFTIPGAPAVNCSSTTTTDGLSGDACVDSCRYQGGCRFGYGCSGVGGVGGARIGLCLPAGSGEVGAACTADSQCVFGYCSKGKCSRDCTADDLCPTGSACLAGGAPAVEGVAFKRCQ